MQPDARACTTLFICGDVMTGRGIDQILPHPSAPQLFEPYVRSAEEYVELAQRVNGPIERPQDFAYIWGDALSKLERMHPDVRIVNLETAVTTSDDAWPRKGIHYRMHPANVGCLTVAGLHCCVLANNHTLDWGRRGLQQTLSTLRRAGLQTAGAGEDIDEACAPAVFDLPGKGRVLVFAAGTPDSGVPAEWAATADRSGVWFLDELQTNTVAEVAARVRSHKRAGDLVLMSLHWGGNWGYEIPRAHRSFAHQLIDLADVDLVHGHSSHHPKPIELYRGKLVVYGCGDFLNDYEGITGYEAFRPELALMYFPTVDLASGRLAQMTMTPTRVRRFRIERADRSAARWLQETLNRESEPFGICLRLLPDDTLALVPAGCPEVP